MSFLIFLQLKTALAAMDNVGGELIKYIKAVDSNTDFDAKDVNNDHDSKQSTSTR